MALLTGGYMGSADGYNNMSFQKINNKDVINYTGIITSFQVAPYSGQTISGCQVGIFYGTYGDITCRDYVTLGNISNNYPITGIEMNCVAGDMVGIYGTGGGAENLYTQNRGTDDTWWLSIYTGALMGCSHVAMQGAMASVPLLYVTGGSVTQKMSLGNVNYTDQNGYLNSNTVVDRSNPSSKNGYITKVYIKTWDNWTDFYVGTLYGSSQDLTPRDYMNIGLLPPNTNNLVTGLAVEVKDGDFLGLYASYKIASKYFNGSGYTSYHSGNAFTTGGQQTYLPEDWKICAYATGYIGDIDIGTSAVDGTTGYPPGYMCLNLGNPANKTGKLDVVQVYEHGTLTSQTIGAKVGTFYGSGTSWTMRDYVTLGILPVGYNVFTGLELDVEVDDIIGFIEDGTGAGIAWNTTGGGGYVYAAADYFDYITHNDYTYDSRYPTMRSAISGIGSAPPPIAPTVTTQAVTDIDITTATGNGDVTSDGGDTITERGVCVALTADPTTADTKFTSAGTIGVFTAPMTGLTPNTNYHARAYAINSVGTSYGVDVIFKTNATSYRLNRNLFVVGGEVASQRYGLTMPSWGNDGIPSSPKQFEFGFNTDTNILQVYVGSSWVNFSP